MTERNIVTNIASYLQLQYPGIIYRFDLAADLKLTIGQAVRHNKIHPYRGYPDLFVAQPKKLHGHHRGGLFLELKREGTKVFNRDGRIRADGRGHLIEQSFWLEKLREAGYIAEFAIGFDHAKALIDYYVTKKNTPGFDFSRIK